jgi:hypothetical protein
MVTILQEKRRTVVPVFTKLDTTEAKCMVGSVQTVPSKHVHMAKHMEVYQDKTTIIQVWKSALEQANVTERKECANVFLVSPATTVDVQNVQMTAAATESAKLLNKSHMMCMT